MGPSRSLCHRGYSQRECRTAVLCCMLCHHRHKSEGTKGPWTESTNQPEWAFSLYNLIISGNFHPNGLLAFTVILWISSTECKVHGTTQVLASYLAPTQQRLNDCLWETPNYQGLWIILPQPVIHHSYILKK